MSDVECEESIDVEAVDSHGSNTPESVTLDNVPGDKNSDDKEKAKAKSKKKSSPNGKSKEKAAKRKAIASSSGNSDAGGDAESYIFEVSSSLESSDCDQANDADYVPERPKKVKKPVFVDLAPWKRIKRRRIPKGNRMDPDDKLGFRVSEGCNNYSVTNVFSSDGKSINGVTLESGTPSFTFDSTIWQSEPYWTYFDNQKTTSKTITLTNYLKSCVDLLDVVGPFVKQNRQLQVEGYKRVSKSFTCVGSEEDINRLRGAVNEGTVKSIMFGPVGTVMELIFTAHLDLLMQRNCCGGNRTMCSFCCGLLTFAADVIIAFLVCELNALSFTCYYTGHSGVMVICHDYGLMMTQTKMFEVQTKLNKALQFCDGINEFADACIHAMCKSQTYITSALLGKRGRGRHATHSAVESFVQRLRIDNQESVKAVVNVVRRDVRRREPTGSEASLGMMSCNAVWDAVKKHSALPDFDIRVLRSLKLRIQCNHDHDFLQVPFTPNPATGCMAVMLRMSCAPHLTSNGVLQIPVTAPFTLRQCQTIDTVGFNTHAVYNVKEGATHRNTTMAFPFEMLTVDLMTFVSVSSLGKRGMAAVARTSLRRTMALKNLGLREQDIPSFGENHGIADSRATGPVRPIPLSGHASSAFTAVHSAGRPSVSQPNTAVTQPEPLTTPLDLSSTGDNRYKSVRMLLAARNQFNLADHLNMETMNSCHAFYGHFGTLENSIQLVKGQSVLSALFQLASVRVTETGGGPSSALLKRICGPRGQSPTDFIQMLISNLPKNNQTQGQAIESFNAIYTSVNRMSHSERIQMLLSCVSPAHITHRCCVTIQLLCGLAEYRTRWCPWPFLCIAPPPEPEQ